MIQYSHIIIHHSFTKDSGTVSWDDIVDYHTKTLGWKDVGYNFGVELIDDDYLCFVGRPLGMIGAHCKQSSMNSLGIGICCVGNYDEVEPSSVMLDVLVYRLIKPMMKIFDINPLFIKLHRDFATYKSCPGKLFRQEHIIGRLR